MAHVERFTALQREVDRQVDSPLVAAGGRVPAIAGMRSATPRRSRSEPWPTSPPATISWPSPACSHRHLMQWITRNRRWGTGGYIRIHEREVPQ